MHLKFKSTLDATDGKSFGFGNKPRPYGDVTGVIQEEGCMFQKLLTESYARKRAMNKPAPHISDKDALNLGENYNGSKATLTALYSSGYINTPVFHEASKKPHPMSQGLREAMKEKNPAHRIYAPSIIF